VTWLGSSFRLPESDLGDCWSVSFSFSPDVIFLFPLSVIMGTIKKGALIKMMVKIIDIDTVPQSLLSSPLIGVTCCFLCAFWGCPLCCHPWWPISCDLAHLWIQSVPLGSTVSCDLAADSVAWLKPWAPCSASYLLSFVLWLPVEAVLLQGGWVLGLMQGILRDLCKEAVSGGRRENGWHFSGNLNFRQPGFGLLGGVAAAWCYSSLLNVADAELHDKPDLGY